MNFFLNKQRNSIKKIVCTFLLLVSSSYALADDSCINVSKNSSLKAVIQPNNAFFNCFKLLDVANHSYLAFVGDGNYLYDLELLEFHANGAITHVSDHSADSNGLNIFEVNSLYRDLGFKIKPIDALNADKKVMITFLEYEGTHMVSITMQSLPAKNPEEKTNLSR